MLYCLGRPQIQPLGFACVDTGPTYGPKNQEHSLGLRPHKRQDNGMAFRWENGFVPEGQHDRSQARSAWETDAKRSPVPEGRLKSLSVPSKPRSVQSSRWDGSIFLMIPGTSCLATIVLSLRDKNHAPIEAPRLILALMGLQTSAKFFGPFGQ